MTKITNEMFHIWKKEPVTKALMEALLAYRADLNEAMTNSDVIEEKDSRAKLLRMIGLREGIDLVLNLEVDQLVENEHEDNPDGA